MLSRTDLTDPTRAPFGSAQVKIDSPNTVDNTVIEELPANPENYRPLPHGTPHPDNARTGLDLRLVWQGPVKAANNQVKILRVYTTGPDVNANWYNFAKKFSADGNAGPIYVRSYEYLRAEYERSGPLAKKLPLTVVIGLVVTNQGSGYTSAPAVVFGGPGTGAAANAIIDLKSGKLVGLELTAEGTGYVTAPTISFTGGGGGTGAAASASIQPQDAYLVHEEMQKLDQENPQHASLFVKVHRVYETLPGPWEPFTEWDDNYGAVTGQRRAVLITDPTPQVATSSASGKTVYESRDGSSIVAIETDRTWGTAPYDKTFEVKSLDNIPEKFIADLPTRTEGQTLPGEPGPPELAEGEIGRTSSEVNKFWKRDTVTKRDPVQFPRTLHDAELGGVQTHGSTFGDVLDIAETLDNRPQIVDQGFPILESSVKALGRDRTLKRTVTRAGATLGGAGADLLLTYRGSGYCDNPGVLFGPDSGTIENGSDAAATAIISPLHTADAGVVELVWTHNGDENGAFFFLGQRGGGGTWRNPHTAGDIIVYSTTDVLAQGTFDSIVDRQPSNTYFVNRDFRPECRFDLGAGRTLLIKQLTYRQRADFGSSCTAFEIQGSTDGTTWGQTQHVDVSGEASAWWHKLTLPNFTVPYRFFRIRVDAGKSFLSIGELELYGTLTVPAEVSILNVVTGVNVTNGGHDYTVPPEVVFTGGGGTGAAGTAMVTNGVVVAVAITDHGANYTSVPTIAFRVNGRLPGTFHRAAATAVLTAGAVSGITVTNGGLGFVVPPHVRIVSRTGTGATAHAVLTADAVTSIVVDTAGSGYLGPPVVVITPVGDPEAIAEIAFGLTNIVVDNGGSGFTSPPAVRIVGDGTLGIAQAILGFPLDSVRIDVGGSYAATPTVVFGGDGTGAAGTAIRGFSVASTTVTAGGSNYLTQPTVVATGNAQFEALIGRPIESILMTALGSGFTLTPAVVITGDGSGATAHAIRSFALATIAVGAGGTGYTVAPTVNIALPTGTFGRRATAHAVLTAGAVTSIVIDDAGYGYLSAPVVSLSGGDGTGATSGAVTLAAGGAIDSIVVDTVGSNYSAPPVVTFTGAGGGTGAVPVATLNLVVAGPIVKLNMLNAGSGYTSAPTLTIQPGTSGGTGATATATLATTGPVIAVNLSNAGSGYTLPVPVTFVGAGTAALATGLLATAGSVKSITLHSGGEGWTAATIQFTGGGGSGAAAHVTFEDHGYVKTLTLLVPGGPYTVPPIVSFLGGFCDLGSVVGWTYTGAMAAARQDHTATKLFDGRVLVVGGYNGDLIAGAQYIATCEIYDPTTGTWSATGSLATGRYGHTATRIDGTGFVLITGGYNGSILGTCEIFNPGTGLWTTKASMSRTRQQHSAHLLNDNTVLVVGGLPGSGAGTSEVYDPVGDTWTVKGSTTKRHRSQPHDAAGHRLSTGKVIAATFQFSDNSHTVELYTPGTGLWTLTGNVPNHDGPIMVPLIPDFAGGGGGEYFADRLLLFGGGLISGSYPIDSQLYGSGTGVWTAKGNLTQGRSRSVGVQLPGGEKVLTCGGWIGSYPGLKTTEIFDVNTGLWTVVEPMNQTRYAHTATLLDNGLVLVTGGDAEHVTNSTNTCELYTSVAVVPVRDPATALYIIDVGWGEIQEIQTDPTEGIRIIIDKAIVPARSIMPAGYVDQFQLNKWRSIMIVSKVDLNSLPLPDVYHTSQHISFPPLLLAVSPIWDQDRSFSNSNNPVSGGITGGGIVASGGSGTASITVSAHGTMLVKKRGGFRGAAIGRVERQFFFGPPPDASVPSPTVIMPSSGTAIIKGGSNSQSTSGSTLTIPLNQAGQPAHVGDLMPGSTPSAPIIFSGYANPVVNSGAGGSVSSRTQVVDIDGVLTAGIVIDTGFATSGGTSAGGLVVAAQAAGRFIVDIPPSTPTAIIPGMSILAQVLVEKWRFGLYVRMLVYLDAPPLS